MKLVQWLSAAVSSAVLATALLPGAAPAQTRDTEPAPADSQADRRAADIVGAMTLAEKLILVRGFSGTSPRQLPKELFFGQQAEPEVDAKLKGTSGFVPGIPRLGVPDLHETDGSLGIANGFAGFATRPGDEATALPAGPLMASTWDEALLREAGALLGREARSKGFNVVLGPAFNLARDPRNGRNFEYFGEDPLVAGMLSAAMVEGIQSQQVIAVPKHLIMYDQSHAAEVMDATIGERAMRESDLLPFEIVVKRSNPGAIMCSYNIVNGAHACESAFLLTRVLRKDWGWKGFVMSDWGAVHSTIPSVMAGLDQDSAHSFDKGGDYFGKPLADAVARGEVPEARINEMALRIVGAMARSGLLDNAPAVSTDRAAHAAIVRRVAEGGIVLLKNERGVLPLAASARKIAVIGGHADAGVLTGGGSSQVIPYGGSVVVGSGVITRQIYVPSSPLRALQAALPNATVSYDPGTDPVAAARAARGADVVIIFAARHASEGMDQAAIGLSDDLNGVIGAVAKANPRTVVVLETDNPVTMPWLGDVAAVLQAWYPGQAGGEAIASILSGQVNPSGKTVQTFYADARQLPRPVMPRTPSVDTGFGGPPPKPFAVDYDIEGAAVGYRWLDRTGEKPLFPFGYGLSYTRYDYSGLKLSNGGPAPVSASITLRNSGKRKGSEVAQMYLVEGPNGLGKRLVGWAKVALEPGQAQRVRIDADPLLLSQWDDAKGEWMIPNGDYTIAVGPSSARLDLRARIRIAR